MAMLAGPRRKVKLSKDPNNLNWSNDDDKFGQRMLERMGWQKGKGLGANEDGKVDHIAVTLKSDNTGVGCTKSHADNWIAHQDDFGALLADLNANHSNTNSGTNTPDTEKVLSLESHSKSAKGRVHYKKFTRSKDLSAKNAQDLNCVFGRRKSKSTNKIQSEAEVLSTDPAPGKDKDSNYGVVTTTSKQSVQEYFAQKMAELQRSRDRETESQENGNVAINDFDNAFGAGFGGSGVSCELGVRYEDVEDDYTHSFADRPQGVAQNDVAVKSESYKKEKRKKMIDEGKDVAEGGGDLSESIECDVEPSKKKRKKDKKRRKAVNEEVVCDVAKVTEKDNVVDEGGDIAEGAGDLGKSSDCDVEPSKKKRKKDKKRKKGADEEVVCDVTEVTEEESKGKKKKGKKGKKNLKESISDENVDEDGLKEESEEAADTAVDADEGKMKKKKKKKKKSDKDSEAEEESNNSEVVEEEEKAQKTKRSKGKADVKKDRDGEITESRGKRKLKGASEISEAAPKKARRR